MGDHPKNSVPVLITSLFVFDMCAWQHVFEKKKSHRCLGHQSILGSNNCLSCSLARVNSTGQLFGYSGPHVVKLKLVSFYYLQFSWQYFPFHYTRALLLGTGFVGWGCSGSCGIILCGCHWLRLDSWQSGKRSLPIIFSFIPRFGVSEIGKQSWSSVSVTVFFFLLEASDLIVIFFPRVSLTACFGCAGYLQFSVLFFCTSRGHHSNTVKFSIKVDLHTSAFISGLVWKLCRHCNASAGETIIYF